MERILANKFARIIILDACVLLSGVCGNLIADEIIQRGVSVKLMELKSLWVAVAIIIVVSLSQIKLEYAGYRDRLREAVFDDLVQEMKSAMKGSGQFLDAEETKRILGLDRKLVK